MRPLQTPGRCRRCTIALLSVLLTCSLSARADAYQTFGIEVNNRIITLVWKHFPVRYYVTDRGVAGVTASQFRDAAARALATWEAVPTASVSTTFVGFTSANAGEDDGQNTLGFQDRPDLERVLGSTDFLIDDVTGEIVESDIFFNSTFSWSVAASGESGKFDLESIILHETGHLFGLGHSAIGETELLAGGGRRVVAAEAVMFPIAFSPGNITDRTPRADDIAGLSELYPKGAFTASSGTLQGRVTKGGKGVPGAHVVAFNPRTGALVGGFTLDDTGGFSISSLAPGPYIVRAEPVDDGDLDSFFDDDTISRIDLNFRVGFAEQLVVVPSGGASQSVEIKVAAK